jgi:hypothetical protein
LPGHLAGASKRSRPDDDVDAERGPASDAAGELDAQMEAPDDATPTPPPDADEPAARKRQKVSAARHHSTRPY